MLSRARNCRIAIAFIVALLFIINVSHMLFIELDENGGYRQKLSIGGTSPTGANPLVERPRYKPISNRKKGVVLDLVKPGDYIYYKDQKSWDSAPIVIEDFNLIFFTVPKAGCTVWKQLFRRMMGIANWKLQDDENGLPHNAQNNGLKYLYDYNITEASIMMTSPAWTRAMMVRDPKERFLSAFLDKSIRNDHKHIIDKCCRDKSCVEGAQDISGFLKLCSVCNDDHWRPQSLRVDYKYWPYITNVLHIEDAADDAKKLLQQIGAWEFGATGWGEHGDGPIFGSKSVSAAGTHSNYASFQVWKWYTPETELQVEAFYQGDYENPMFGFTKGECLTCT